MPHARGALLLGRLPVADYGGTQRMVVRLARGLAEAGHRVSLLAAPDPRCRKRRLVPVDPAEARRPDFAIAPHLPKGMDLLLSYVQVRRPPEAPWIHRLEGNRKPGESSPPNTIYLSEHHARRHGGHAWVYNGVDPRDFRFRREKDDTTSSWDASIGPRAIASRRRARSGPAGGSSWRADGGPA